jgi:hypothetical protein
MFLIFLVRITIPYQNLALSIDSRQGINVFNELPTVRCNALTGSSDPDSLQVYFCPYNGADGQLWRLELIDPPNDDFSDPQSA